MTMADILPPQIAPQGVESLERAEDLDHPDHLEVESLARVVDLDLLQPALMTTALMTIGDPLLRGHLAAAAPAVASPERVVDPVESLARAVDQVARVERDPREVPQAAAPVITFG